MKAFVPWCCPCRGWSPARKGRLQGKQPKLPLAARKTIHRRYHDSDDNASLDDHAEEYSVGRFAIRRIISGATPRP
jgi:hypothetical protein